MDPHFEFDAPKWFDLADFASKGESWDANSSLNSSWFDHTHPLHESQDSLDEEECEKTNNSSLNKTKTLKRHNSVSSHGKTNASKPSKKFPDNKNTLINSKKSLGVKSTVRVKRGDRAAIAKDKSHVAEASGSRQVNKRLKDNEQGQRTPDGFDFSIKHVFTPPFSPNAGNNQFSPKNEECTAICNSNVLNSPRRVPCSSASTSPEYKALLSPKHSSVAPQAKLNKASLSHPPSPVKASLRSKTITKAAVQGFQRVDKNCTSKRRQLPAIPIDENIKKHHSPHPAFQDCGQSEKSPPCTANPQDSIENEMHNRFSHQNTVISPPANDGTDTEIVKSHLTREEIMQQIPLRKGKPGNPSIEEMLREHNLKVYKEKSKYTKYGWRITATKKITTYNKQLDSKQMKTSSEKENKLSDNESSEILRFKETETKTLPKGGISHALDKLNAEIADGSDLECAASTDELSVQEMLLQHQRKIMSAKCKYDINGRRIQSATPSFCPAPVTSSTIAKPASSTATKYLRRSCVAAPDTSQPNASTVGKKRLANSISSSVSVKQKRRSCADLSSAASGTTVECLTAAVKPRFLSRSSSSTSTLSQSTAVDNKNLNRQKRRSCMDHTLASPCDVDDTEREIREMIAKHNSKLAAKK